MEDALALVLRALHFGKELGEDTPDGPDVDLEAVVLLEKEEFG